MPIEEKLFRKVKVSADPAEAAETLQLLSKKRMQENEINVLWKSHFVDRQVQAAVRELFSATPDSSIIRLRAKKLASLSPKDIRTSLQRASISFDFPMKPNVDGKPRPRNASSGGPAAARKKSAKGAFAKLGIAKSKVLLTLIEHGLLKSGSELTAEYMGQTLKARIDQEGHVEFRGATYLSPSAAGAAAKQSVSGKFMATDGWTFWQYRTNTGELVPVKTARQKFLAEGKKEKKE